MCGFGDNWVKKNGADQPAPDQSYDADRDRALLIFIKNPELGKVKTRLAKTIGDDAAMKVYLDLLAHTRAVSSELELRRMLYYSSFIDENDDWDKQVFEKHVQVQGDLGLKMAAAFQEAFEKGYERVVIIGSDCLNIQPKHLEQAFRALKFHDFVLGPANDGGYYLLGMKAFEPSLFLDKEWSTEHVLSSTLEDIRRLSKTVYLLEELIDVDTEEDFAAATELKAKSKF